MAFFRKKFASFRGKPLFLNRSFHLLLIRFHREGLCRKTLLQIGYQEATGSLDVCSARLPVHHRTGDASLGHGQVGWIPLPAAGREESDL